MKKIHLTLVLMLLAVLSFSQPYYIYTAISNGNWTVPGNWTAQLRTDGIFKNKFIIPGNYNITLGDNPALESTDVEIYVFGAITIASTTNLNLTAQSSILLLDGIISGNSANQKIKIGNVLKYKGNTDGVRAGYLIMDNTTGTSPNGLMLYSILPVNFTSFYISKSGANIQLDWSTDSEIDNSHFDVERSFNGLEWERIASVAGAVNTGNQNNYVYHDKNVSNSIVYYRLRQVDINSRATYSSIKVIRLSGSVSPVKIFGADKRVVIDLNASVKGSMQVQVVNTNGQVVSIRTYTDSSYRIDLKIDNISSGVYIVHVSAPNGWSETKKVIL